MSDRAVAQPAGIALDAYLRRLDYTGPIGANADSLAELHLAHATHIPFENIDVLIGRPLALDIEHLQDKLVDRGRGGYCYEQNILLAAVLEQLGFTVTRLAARVRYNANAVRPRTHMLLLIEEHGAQWLADVGFGGEGLLLPVRFAPAVESRQFHWTYRVIEEPAPWGSTWVLQSRHPSGWQDLYAFTLEPQFEIDFVMANHFVATHASSPFTRVLVVQRPGPDVRRLLRGREFTLERGQADVQVRMLADDREVLEALRAEFGLVLPPGFSLPR